MKRVNSYQVIYSPRLDSFVKKDSFFTYMEEQLYMSTVNFPYMAFFSTVSISQLLKNPKCGNMLKKKTKHPNPEDKWLYQRHRI